MIRACKKGKERGKRIRARKKTLKRRGEEENKGKQENSLVRKEKTWGKDIKEER